MHICQPCVIIHANVCRSHTFDAVDRAKPHPKRKATHISTLDQPARGAEGYRTFHKCNEEKILAHRRSGISDMDIESALHNQDI